MRFFILPLLCLSFTARAAETPYQLSLRLPLIDTDHQQVSGFSPSLWQATTITQDYYQGMHWVISGLFDSRAEEKPGAGEYWALLAFDYLSQSTPLGSTWLHEEGHRAVLNHFGMASHNGVYTANFGDDEVPVDRVRDSDLIRLKREHPADFVRLSTAGMEAESQFALNLEKSQFFEAALPRQRFLLLLSHLGPIGYRVFCDSKSADESTRDDLKTEGPAEKDRDFTGYDCVSYVYDLFRPHESYEDRGPHPSGVGISRYRSRDDLTATEKQYLRRMALYSWFNLVDPFLFSFDGWQWNDWQWTATLRHQLAPFGHSFEENFFLRQGDERHLLILRQYTNAKGTRPGVEWQSLGGPLQYRTGFWWQPGSLLYRNSEWRPGGFLAISLQRPWTEQLRVFGEVLAKTRGWMADEIALEPSQSLRLGLDWVIR